MKLKDTLGGYVTSALHQCRQNWSTQKCLSQWNVCCYLLSCEFIRVERKLVCLLWLQSFFSTVCADWRRAVLAEGQPSTRGHCRRLFSVPPPQQRRSGRADEPTPTCHHPGAIWTGPHSATHRWDSALIHRVEAKALQFTVEKFSF